MGMTFVYIGMNLLHSDIGIRAAAWCSEYRIPEHGSVGGDRVCGTRAWWVEKLTAPSTGEAQLA